MWFWNFSDAQSNIQRKAGSSALQTRTPLQDKIVNHHTANSTFKKPNSDVPNKQIVKSLFRPKPTDLEILGEDFCNVDYDEQFEELYSTPLTENHIFTFLNNYLDDNTPPPSPQMLPDISFEELSYQDVREANDDDYFEMSLFKEPFKNKINLFPLRCPTPPAY